MLEWTFVVQDFRSMVKIPRNTQGTPGIRPARPSGREADIQQKSREFQAALRREYLLQHDPEEEAGRVASGYNDQVMVSGERARECMANIHELARLSPTFRGVLNKALADLDTLWITIGRGGGNSRSTIGARDEKIYINLEQGDLMDLLIHECGHALAKLEDGPLGGFGPNQRFQAVIKRELDMGRGGCPGLRHRGRSAGQACEPPRGEGPRGARADPADPGQGGRVRA